MISTKGNSNRAKVVNKSKSERRIFLRKLFFLMIRRPPRSPLLPFPTLFRSHTREISERAFGRHAAARGDRPGGGHPASFAAVRFAHGGPRPHHGKYDR